MQHLLSCDIYEPINHGVSEAFQLWSSSDSVGDAEMVTASWYKRTYENIRTYERNERGAVAKQDWLDKADRFDLNRSFRNRFSSFRQQSACPSSIKTPFHATCLIPLLVPYCRNYSIVVRSEVESTGNAGKIVLLSNGPRFGPLWTIALTLNWCDSLFVGF